MEGANATTASGRDAFERAVNAREGGGESGMKRGLVTVCNHVSTFDDPGVLSAMIPWSTFASEARRGGVRWTLCTDEICAKNALREQFFLCGKALAIKRGGGVDQPAMRTAANLLARGDWVHLFPGHEVDWLRRFTAFTGSGILSMCTLRSLRPTIVKGLVRCLV